MPPSPFSGPIVAAASPEAGASRIDLLLDAAEAVIVRDGIASLTRRRIGPPRGPSLEHARPAPRPPAQG